MPVHKKNGKWWWGGRGPFNTKEKAEEVERAAYANGYTGDEGVEEFAIDELPEDVQIAADGWVTKNGGHILIGKNGEIQRPKNSAEKSASKKPSLTPTEKTYLSSYSGDDFLRVNSELRNGNENAEGVAKLDSAISKNTVGAKTLYRGMSKADAKKLFPDGVIKKGMVISDKGYASTSKRKDIAGMFSVGGVMLQIDSDPNAKGIDMSSLSSNAHEDEVLLPRGAQMVVESIHPPKEPGKPVIVKVSYGSPMAKDSVLAFDRASRRRLDDNGYLHVSQTHLTKEQVAPYWGKEIPGYGEHGLDPDKIYYAYRSGEELEKAKGTFNGMPLLILHKQDSADAPLKELRVGSIGTTPQWDAPYLDNALTVTDKAAIDQIMDDTLKEISCGYFFEPDFTPGFFNGVHYDFVMRNIRGNHVALVKEGRAGPDVYVHDGMPSTLKKVQSMQLNKKQVAAFATLATYLKPRLATDAAPADLAKLIGSYKKPGTLAKAVARQYGSKLAQDMEIDAGELAELMEAAEDVVEPEEEHDEGADEVAYDEGAPEEFLRATLEGKVPDDVLEKLIAACAKPVTDENEKEKIDNAEADRDDELEKAKGEIETLKQERDNAKEKATMDANSIRQQITAEFKAKSDAARKVRDLIGEVDAMAFDSANDIYAHALKQKGINIKQYEPAAFKGMVDVMTSQKSSTQTTIAEDSALTGASFEGQFAGLKNIKVN